ncbi:MAG: pathogenicity locus [Candidatus Moranbacteria bacterium]|nr:pathogenicity locus [Candidatus Moranbacteria bacterium]
MFLGRKTGNLTEIPGVGKSIAEDLRKIGVRRVADLRGRDPERLYERSNRWAGTVQDRCLLYVFRLAVYYANTKPEDRDSEKLKWWNWKDRK